MLLPTLSTGKLSENLVFLHGDPSAQPFRIDGIAVALSAATNTKKIIGLGQFQFQFNYFWMVTFQSCYDRRDRG